MASLLTPDNPLPSISKSNSTNHEKIFFIRILSNMAGGIIAGLLGLTGKDGIALYLALSLMISSTVILKTSLHPSKYLTLSMPALLFSGIFDRNALLSYLLFWTMLFSFR